ncbi:WD40 repeat-like protein [Mytilinidion resinicola]|uniref:WD40 repeat-like protein n=1 Tax=Mytilinidion resinicola TaxID=574789 RepID=A0A6A6YD39_9PEZI|nr:WD40 repeat-like protein [Mytilinidion resinicola]KAF2806488.1 WD40 repeat-like protein [Mytilinidion resinicola]
MAEVLPKIRVTDPQSREAAVQSPASIKSPSTEGDSGRLSKPVSKTERPVSSGKTSPTKLRTAPGSPSSQTNGQGAQNGGSGAKQQSEAAIDPLSQHILKRTHTQATLPQILRSPTNTEHGSVQSPTLAGSETFPSTKHAADSVREVPNAPAKEKKKGVSFLSRFIGNKKKGTLDGPGDDESETGERPEGMDAQLFSQPFDNLGYSPRYPQPPAYIKVRTKFKKEKEFNRLFLAQELRSKKNPADKKKSVDGTGVPPTPSGSAASNDPVWATEFSKDGKYLAAGGQDRIVRVWAVISTPEERRRHEKEEAEGEAADDRRQQLTAPVFQSGTFREYLGHTATILDLSWSKNNFLLSSSMDKTVRLWHISRSECLCTFKHTDFVPSIQFHPRDDRFFLAGSLDTKLRLWSIPDKSVAFWNQLPDMITAVSFTPDGKTCIAGTLSGLCMFYETEGLKYQTQIHVKSTHGKNAKGSKITGIQTMSIPPEKSNGEVKLLISSNDSRIRLYNFRDKSLEVKFRGHENNYSQIRATFSEDASYVLCGSEDRKAYIWSTGPSEGEKRNQRPVEMFEAHTSITTCTTMAPLKTRQLLSTSEDPVYDLCNPPPVTLMSRADSLNSSRAPTDAGSAQATPAASDPHFKRVEESPAYIARSSHPGGNIIVTADYTGSIKVFRQDCAYSKRLRALSNEAWETSSVFSKKIGSAPFGRPSSIATKASGRTRRDSTSTQPPSDRILSWRRDMEKDGSFDSASGPKRKGRSVSPRKSLGAVSMGSLSRQANTTPPLNPTSTTETLPSVVTTSPKSSLDKEGSGIPIDPIKLIQLRSRSDPAIDANNRDAQNPMWVQGGQSWAFWNMSRYRDQTGSSSSQQLRPPRPELNNRRSTVSALSSEEEEDGIAEGAGAEDEVRCKSCGGSEFKLRVVREEGREEKRVVCMTCGAEAG